MHVASRITACGLSPCFLAPTVLRIECFVPSLLPDMTLLADRAFRAQEPCESRGGRPGLPSLISLMVSVDVKQH